MNSTVRKVAAGAADYLPLVVVTNLARTPQAAAADRRLTIGTAGVSHCFTVRHKTRNADTLVMGAEGGGMRRLTKEHCDELGLFPCKAKPAARMFPWRLACVLFEVLRQNNKL